jgi:hypothetical protein
MGRNLNRISKEIKLYNYEPLKRTFYSVDKNYFRIQKKMDQLINEYYMCLNKNSKCTSSNKVEKIYGKITFKNQ